MPNFDGKKERSSPTVENRRRGVATSATPGDSERTIKRGAVISDFREGRADRK